MENSEKIVAVRTAQEIAGADDFTPRYLDAAKLTLTRSPVGTPRLEIQGEVCHLRVVVRRLLPLSNPERYISLAADEDTEIGILNDPGQLDSGSLRILKEELHRRYFTPVIEEIYRVKEQFGIHEWEVRTVRGRVTFSVRVESECQAGAARAAFRHGCPRQPLRYSGLSGVGCAQFSAHPTAPLIRNLRAAPGACGGQAPALRANEWVSRQKTERKERSIQQRHMRGTGPRATFQQAGF